MMMEVSPLEPPAGFVERAAALGVAFEAGELERLGAFLAMMLETNKTHNLTAITDPTEAWTRHILDALTLLAVLSTLEDGSRVADIGSGGGVPGVPLAIVLPGLNFTLVDATGKKATFLRDAVSALGLTNVTVLQDRAERMGQDLAHREQYDAVVARAVGPMPMLIELLAPLAKVGGAVLAIKGAKAAEELASAKDAIRAVGATYERTLETPTGKVLAFLKARKTALAYPRSGGLPKTKPLGSERKK